MAGLVSVGPCLVNGCCSNKVLRLGQLWPAVSGQGVCEPFVVALICSHVFVCAPLLPCSVGMMFIPNDDALEAKCKEIFEKVAKAENFKASRQG